MTQLFSSETLPATICLRLPTERRGGAYIRVTPRPMDGSVVTMTVPVGPTTTPEEVAIVLEQELEALIQMV